MVHTRTWPRDLTPDKNLFSQPFSRAFSLRLTLYKLMGRLASLDYTSPTLTHPQPPNSVPRSSTSDSLKHEYSRQPRALNTNTQGSQGERKGEGTTLERCDSLKKRPPANKAKLDKTLLQSKSDWASISANVRRGPLTWRVRTIQAR